MPREKDLLAARGEAVALLQEVKGDTGRYNDTNYIFPKYIVSQLPRGFAGLSSPSSAAAIMIARRRVSTRWRPRRWSTSTSACAPGRRRTATSCWSAADDRRLGGSACLIARSRSAGLGSAIEVVKLGSYFYGSILGVFALAVLTKRATAAGALWGLFVGMASVALVSQLTTIHFLWYNVVGAVAVFVSGLLISALRRG